MAELKALLIATSSAGKLREVTAILQGLPLRLESLADHPPSPSPQEDGDTFEANARLKAIHYARLTGRWALADDSGLVVDALGGAPGVHSARYAGSDGDAAANNAKLVDALQGISEAARTARFCCAVALADRSEVLAVAFGTWEGVIVEAPAGTNGFGYDPHFFVPDQGMTSAQMEPDLKNRLSHRSTALRKLRDSLPALLGV